MANWNTDAQFAEKIDEEYLFANQKIREFLRPRSYSQFILVASKGMGKTLLMRHKRHNIERDDAGFILIPKNETSDYVHLPSSPSNELLTSMRQSVFWSDLWVLAISISMLLYFPHRVTDDERKELFKNLDETPLPRELREQLKAAFANTFVTEMRPSSVLDLLFQSGKSGIEKLRARGKDVIWRLFLKHINSGCFAFIDSFDQELSRHFGTDLNIWCAAQNGLLRASWELSRHNRHVKVYATVRQEAYASFSDTERANIRGSLLLLEYSKLDLRHIFTNAVRYYENVETIPQFVGLEKIYNGYLRLHEDPFEYLHRHTIGIPRWLMTMGTEISNSREGRRIVKGETARKTHQKTITDLVNRISADLLAADYLKSEMGFFFDGGQPDYLIDKLLGRINSTVLSFSGLSRISHKYVEEKLATAVSGTNHPFCLLYNLGLLGVVANSPSSTNRFQLFKKPYEFDWNYEEILPKDPDGYYLLHPSLHHIVQKNNIRFNFNKVRIGDGLLWSDKDDKKIDKETVKLFISYAHEDVETVEDIAETIEDFLNTKSILHDIWLDKWSMKSGRWIQDQLFEGLNRSDFLILIISTHSLGSNAVTVEWKTKFAEKIRSGSDSVLPFIIDSTKPEAMPDFLRQIYTYTFDGDETKVHRLINDLLFWKTEKAKGS